MKSLRVRTGCCSFQTIPQRNSSRGPQIIRAAGRRNGEAPATKLNAIISLSEKFFPQWEPLAWVEALIGCDSIEPGIHTMALTLTAEEAFNSVPIEDERELIERAKRE